MVYSFLLFSLVELIVGAGAGVIAYIAWKHRKQPAGIPTFAIAVIAVVYAIVSASTPFAHDRMLWTILTSLTYSLTLAIAVGAFYLTVEITNRNTYQRSSIVAGLIGLVLASFALAFTDPIHNLLTAGRTAASEGGFIITFGPLFWINTLLALGIILFSIVLLLVELFDHQAIYRKQIVIIIAGFVIGVAFFLWQSIAPIHPAFNLSTVGIFGWCGLTLWGILNVGVLHTAPIARKTLMNSMDDMVFALNADDCIVDINPRARTELDLDSAVVGEPVTTVLADYPEIIDAIDVSSGEREIGLRTDDRARYLHLNVSPVHASLTRADATKNREQPIGRTIVIRDITERKERELEIERQNERLDQFVGVVSHDLRNPLAVAQGDLELARTEYDSEYLDSVAYAHDRMSELIDELLLLARSSQPISETEAVELGDLSERCWRNVHTTAASLTVETDLTVQADRSRLQQLLENLMRNAIEHGGEGVTVIVGTLETGFYVEDDGPGIPPDDRNTVFDTGYSTSDEGTGFGLSIVKQVADAHQWEIDVITATDGGARFEITDVEFSP